MLVSIYKGATQNTAPAINLRTLFNNEESPAELISDIVADVNWKVRPKRLPEMALAEDRNIQKTVSWIQHFPQRSQEKSRSEAIDSPVSPEQYASYPFNLPCGLSLDTQLGYSTTDDQPQNYTAKRELKFELPRVPIEVKERKVL
jgi:hypothetical protein